MPKLETEHKIWPEPIETDAQTLYFIALKEKKESYLPAFEAIKDKVQARLRQEKANQIAKEKLDTLLQETELFDFAKTAEKFNLKNGQTELFKRGAYVQDLGDSNTFFAAAEKLNEDTQISEIISTPSGFYIIKVKERVQPTEEEFKKEKEEFTKRILETKKQKFFQEYLKELKARPKTFIQTQEIPRRNP